MTDLILAELHRHLLYAVGPLGAAAKVETLLADPLIDEVFADEAVQTAAFANWIHRLSDQVFTLTDAVSFATMDAQGIEAAFTFDRHFAIAGFSTIPS